MKSGGSCCKAKKQLMVTFMIPSLSGGGAERVVVNLANQFAKNGFAVDIVLLSGGKDSPYANNLLPGVSIICLRGEQKPSLLLIKIIKALPVIKKLANYIDRTKPDVIFANLCAAQSIWASKIAKTHTNVVVIEHNDVSREIMLRRYKNDLKVSFFYFLMRFSYRHAERIIAVSRGVAESLERCNVVARTKIDYIYNPVVNDTIDSLCQREVAYSWLLKKNKPIFLGMGRLAPQKNFPLLLKAFKLVVEELDSRLIIAGTGSDLEELKQLTLNLELGDRVDFAGFIDNPYSLFTNADVFVLSSDFEGFGNVLVEALACGCQVVSTDCPSGPSEILENGKYGHLVPVHDEKALACAMIKAYKSPKNRELLKRRAQDFSEDKIGQEYICLVEGIMKMSSEN